MKPLNTYHVCVDHQIQVVKAHSFEHGEDQKGLYLMVETSECIAYFPTFSWIIKQPEEPQTKPLKNYEVLSAVNKAYPVQAHWYKVTDGTLYFFKDLEDGKTEGVTAFGSWQWVVNETSSTPAP